MKANDVIKKLNDEKLSCIIFKENEILFTSTERGLRPIIKPILRDEKALSGASVVDKVIGKAAASLVAVSGCKYCYGSVMSETAIKFLQDYGVEYEYGTKVDKIKNDAGNDSCPMEKMVEEFTTAKESYDYLYKFLKEKIVL